MNPTEIFSIGAPVHSRDGECGNLTRVVIDPVAEAITHLVGEPAYRSEQARLVPVSVAQATERRIDLNCTAAEFDRYETAEEIKFLSVPTATAGYESAQLYGWPYYPLDVGLLPTTSPTERVSVDKTPAGETAVRAHACDRPGR